MKSLISTLEPAYRRIHENNKNPGDILRAIHRLNELLENMEAKYKQLEINERTLDQMINKPIDKATSKKIQFDFFNCYEEYFKATYTTLAALSYLVHLSLPHNKRLLFKHSKVQDFLKFISNEYKIDVSIIIDAVIFRAGYIEHPRGRPYDWMTYCFCGVCAVVYFTAGQRQPKEGVYSPHPYAPNFYPPIYCDTFRVGPNYKELYNTLKSFLSLTLVAVSRS